MAKNLSVILATYGPEGQKFLDLCLDSLSIQTYTDFNVILVSSGDYVSEYKPDHYRFEIKRMHSHQRFHFPKAVHEAYKYVEADTENILILNDDIILNKTFIHNMVNALRFKGAEFILNPASNCDRGRLFWKDFEIKYNNKLFYYNTHQYKYEDIDMYDQMRIMHGDYMAEPNIAFTNWCAFYATMMKKSTWDKVGGIDPEYRTGKDDLDFCLRAKKFGIQSALCMHAFALHFSGATADLYLTDEDRSFNEKHFELKMK